MLKVSVPATSANLGPGFDYVGIALELYNHFVFFSQDEKIPDEYSKLQQDSLVHQAFMRLCTESRIKYPGINAAVKAGIPRTRGLGSSAALTVAGLVGANCLLQVGLKKEEILDLATALEGHPDNAAPALLGGLVVCMITPGGVKFIKTMPKKELKVVVAVPEFELPTAKSRQVLPCEVSHRDAVNNTGRFGFFMAAMLTGEYDYLSLAMEDLLHQPYREQLVPGMREVMRSGIEAGALGCCLSGAGPSILAFHDNNGEQISASMKEKWQEYGIKTNTYVLGIAANGTIAEKA